MVVFKTDGDGIINHTFWRIDLDKSLPFGYERVLRNDKQSLYNLLESNGNLFSEELLDEDGEITEEGLHYEYRDYGQDTGNYGYIPLDDQLGALIDSEEKIVWRKKVEESADVHPTITHEDNFYIEKLTSVEQPVLREARKESVEREEEIYKALKVAQKESARSGDSADTRQEKLKKFFNELWYANNGGDDCPATTNEPHFFDDSGRAPSSGFLDCFRFEGGRYICADLIIENFDGKRYQNDNGDNRMRFNHTTRAHRVFLDFKDFCFGEDDAPSFLRILKKEAGFNFAEVISNERDYLNVERFKAIVLLPGNTIEQILLAKTFAEKLQTAIRSDQDSSDWSEEYLSIEERVADLGNWMNEQFPLEKRIAGFLPRLGLKNIDIADLGALVAKRANWPKYAIARYPNTKNLDKYHDDQVLVCPPIETKMTFLRRQLSNTLIDVFAKMGFSEKEARERFFWEKAAETENEAMYVGNLDETIWALNSDVECKRTGINSPNEEWEEVKEVIDSYSGEANPKNNTSLYFKARTALYPKQYEVVADEIKVLYDNIKAADENTELDDLDIEEMPNRYKGNEQKTDKPQGLRRKR